MHIPEPDVIEPLEQKFPYVSEPSLDFMKVKTKMFKRKMKNVHFDWIVFFQSCLIMDPDKRLTCNQLLQHSFFEGFANEFEREKKELLKSTQREMNRMLMSQQQQAAASSQPSKTSNTSYVSGAGQSKGQTQGVNSSTYSCREKKHIFYSNS